MALSGSPLLAGYVNYATSATFTVGSGETADSSFPISNLAQWSLRKPAKITAASSPLTVTVDLGAVKTDIGIVFIYVKGQPSNLAWTILVDDDSGFGSPSYDSSANPQLSTGFNVSHGLLTSYEPWRGRPCVALPDSPVSGRYARWSFTGYALPMELRAAIVGPRYQVAAGIRAGWTSRDRFIGEPGLQNALKDYDLDFHSVTNAEESNLFEIERYSVQSRRVLLIPQPTAQETWLREIALCRFSGAASKTRQNTETYTSSVTFPLEEVEE